MLYFICIRSNRVCRSGQWFASEEEGGPFFFAEIERVGKRTHNIKVGNRVAIPFNFLAPYVVPFGIQISLSAVREPLPVEAETTFKEIESFQRENEEIIEDELERRHRVADPTYTGRIE